GPLLALERKAILVVARDAEALGDVLRRRTHGVAVEGIGEHREGPVEELARPEAPTVAGSVVEEGDPAHGLVAARDHDAGRPREDLLSARRDRLDAGAALPVHVQRSRVG